MEKLERISITLMNKTLIPVITKNEATDFFCIPKANHEILSWLFNHTAIPTLVLAQNEGQLLQVLGIGRFGVEWHLSAKYETIESLHGLSSGANATECCIYCLQKKTKSIMTTEVVVRAASQKRTPTWEGGLFAFDISSKSISLKTSIIRWKHVLPKTLERVHICTLHAMNCIFEKILHLHFSMYG